MRTYLNLVNQTMQDTIGEDYNRETHSTGCIGTDVNMKTLAAIIQKICKHNTTWREHLKRVDITIPDWVMEQ